MLTCGIETVHLRSLRFAQGKGLTPIGIDAECVDFLKHATFVLAALSRVLLQLFEKMSFFSFSLREVIGVNSLIRISFLTDSYCFRVISEVQVEGLASGDGSNLQFQ
jgi:hypothetical protein